MSVRHKWIKEKGSIILMVNNYCNIYLHTQTKVSLCINLTKSGAWIPWCDKVYTFSKNTAGPRFVFQTLYISMVSGKCLYLPQPEFPHVCNGLVGLAVKQEAMCLASSDWPTVAGSPSSHWCDWCMWWRKFGHLTRANLLTRYSNLFLQRLDWAWCLLLLDRSLVLDHF